MNKKDFYEQIKRLQSFYKKDFSKDQLNLWYEKLKDYDNFPEIVTNIINAYSYLPTLDQIKKGVLPTWFNKEIVANSDDDEITNDDIEELITGWRIFFDNDVDYEIWVKRQREGLKL